ncbi:MAG: class I SAM-dependent methyltransferase, partial [Cyanobacteria bacterium P01_G01_bin.49]
MKPLTQVEAEAIQHTAYRTVAALAKNTSIPYCRAILQKIIDANPAFGLETDSFSTLSYLIELRYKTSEKILRERGYQQVIELGAGLTPHALNLQPFVTNYLEVDLEKNSLLKQAIVQEIEPNLKVHYVAGDV